MTACIPASFGVGCGADDPGLGGLLSGSGGGSFVIRGTMVVAENNGVCPVLEADDGFTYHLRQGTNLSNDLFDGITEIGAISRIVVVPRSDLRVACQFGTVVVVTEVLELISPDGTVFPPPAQEGGLGGLLDDLFGGNDDEEVADEP